MRLQALALVLLSAVATAKSRTPARTSDRTRGSARGICESLPSGSSLVCIACTCTNATNLLLWSDDFTNAAWGKAPVGVAAAVITSSDGTSTYADPAGTNAAQRIQFAACPSADDASRVFQLVSMPGADGVGAIYFKPFTGTGSVSISVAVLNGVATANACTSTGGGWVRCAATGSVNTTNNPYIVLGCINTTSYTGHSNTGSADVLVWRAQFEQGTTPTCPIATTTAAVSRSGACTPVCR